MSYKTAVERAGAFLGALLLVFVGWAQAETAAATPGSATFTVTAVAKKGPPPPVSKDDVQLFFGKEQKQIANWQKGDRLNLAILIDESIDTTAGGQWEDLKAFMMEQPASTMIMVGYLRNNTTMVAQDFTADHALAAKALRLPMGLGAIGSSPYLSIMDILKRWPQNNARNSIVVITSGIDYFRGGGFGSLNPDLDSVVARAQRQNTNIWSVYYPSAGHRGRSFFLTNNAQTNIDRLSEQTGAEGYFLGTGMPVSLKPYFDEIGEHLGNQYLVTVAGNGGAKGKYQNAKLKTELPNTELITFTSIWLPGTGTKNQ